MPQNLGVVADNRTPVEKEFDLLHSEVFTSSVPNFFNSKEEASKFVGVFPIDDQLATSSCVAHGKVLAGSIYMFLAGITGGVFVQLSSMFVYRRRVNYPGEGMIPASADTQFETYGAPPYADIPTPATEAVANALAIPDAAVMNAALQYAGLRWVTLVTPGDIDTLAFASNSLGSAPNILIFATVAEWSRGVVEVLTPGLQQGSPEAEVSHCVTILPQSAYIENGKKYVIVQDSAGFGGIFFRSVSEEFIKERTFESTYPLNFDTRPSTAAPTVNLTKDLTIGSTGPDVIALQEALQFMGYLPNVVNGEPFAPTGIYGGMTKTAVLKLQEEYAAVILKPSGLTAGTGYVGSSTRAFLNNKFK